MGYKINLYHAHHSVIAQLHMEKHVRCTTVRTT